MRLFSTGNILAKIRRNLQYTVNIFLVHQQLRCLHILATGNHIHARRGIPVPDKLPAYGRIRMIDHRNRNLPGHLVTIYKRVNNRIR